MKCFTFFPLNACLQTVNKRNAPIWLTLWRKEGNRLKRKSITQTEQSYVSSLSGELMHICGHVMLCNNNTLFAPASWRSQQCLFMLLSIYPCQATINGPQCLDARFFLSNTAGGNNHMVSYNLYIKKGMQGTQDLRKNTPGVSLVGKQIKAGSGSNAGWSHTENSRRRMGFILPCLVQNQRQRVLEFNMCLTVSPSLSHECPTSDDFIATGSFVSKVRHAPHPLRPLLPIHPFLHILWHGLQVTQTRPIGHGGSQAHCATEWVDLDAGSEVHEGHAHGTFVVPLTGKALSFLLLLQLIQSLQDDGAKQAWHLLHLRLIGLYNLPEPVQNKTQGVSSVDVKQWHNCQLAAKDQLDQTYNIPTCGDKGINNLMISQKENKNRSN